MSINIGASTFEMRRGLGSPHLLFYRHGYRPTYYYNNYQNVQNEETIALKYTNIFTYKYIRPPK